MIPTKPQIRELLKWEAQAGIDFWISAGANEPSRIMVAPEILDAFTKYLESNGVHHELVIDDVESELLKDKRARLNSRAKSSALADDEYPNFGLYWTFEEMEAFSIQLAEQYPNLVKREIIGKSIENRDIFALKVSSGAEFGKKPIIFIDSGVHARV